MSEARSLTFGACIRKRRFLWKGGCNKTARWASTDDVQKAIPKCKALNRERVRFEVLGGNDRLVVAFDFRRQAAFVKFVGSHADYDRIDALTVSLF